MRIADVTEFYSPSGGVRSHLNTKGRALRDAGHDHLVVAPGKDHCVGPLDGHSPDVLGTAGVMLVKGPPLPYDPNYHLLWRVGQVRRALRDFQPDVVSLNSLYMASVVLATLPRRSSPVRTVFWHSDFIDTYLRPHFEGHVLERVGDALLAQLWAAVRRLANRCAATLVASNSQAEKLRGHGIERVILVPFGVDRRVFRPEARTAGLRDELLGSASDARLIIGVGRLSAEKNWEAVIKGVLRLRTRQRVRLVVFGEGPERDRLRALADPDTVSLPGAERDRSRLAAAIASADLFVHGGARETYGLSVAEAIASGVPVVAAGSGGVLDLLDMSCAETYEPSSSDACALAMARVLGPNFSRYRSCALAAASRALDSSSQVLELVRVYRLLVAEKAERSCQSISRFTT